MNAVEFGLYVASSDLDVSAEFYGQLFGVAPYLKTPTFVGYELRGGRFGVILESTYAVPVQRGNSTVPNIKVDDIEAEYDRVSALGPSKMQPEIVSVGPMRLFMFADPDGNVIEFFSVTS